MASSGSDGQHPATFYIGQHELSRSYPVTDEVLRCAQEESNYDMLTAPITTDAFHARVISALSPYLNAPAQVSIASKYDCLPSLVLSSLTPADSTITPGNNISQLILTTSLWIDLSSSDPLIADVSRQVLNLEVQYAAFCGAANIMVAGPSMGQDQLRPEGLSQYARAIREALKLGPFIQFHLLFPMSGRDHEEPQDGSRVLARYAREYFKSRIISGNGPNRDDFDCWDTWNTTRTICKYNPRLSVGENMLSCIIFLSKESLVHAKVVFSHSVIQGLLAYLESSPGTALSIPPHLPPLSLRSRWFSEPLRILHIPGSSFHRNNRGDPALSQQQKQLVIRYMRLKNPPWILLSQVDPLRSLQQAGGSSTLEEFPTLPTPVDRSDIAGTSKSDHTPAEASQTSTGAQSHHSGVGSHLEYLRSLQFKLPRKSKMEIFGAGYQDYLQNPLQPLADNLESITYEVFEKDPVKYDWYERAISLALKDWQARDRTSSGRDGRVVIAVVGAGRGPLVKRALQASANTGIEIDLWAVEKNTNAFVLLQRHNIEIWQKRVNLVQSDMRSWTGPFFYANQSASLQGSQSAPNVVRFNVDILVSELLGSFGDNELSPECIDGVQRLLNPEHGLSIPSSYTAFITPIAAPKLHADILTRTASGDSEASQIPYVVMLQAIDSLSTTHRPKSLNLQVEGTGATPHSEALPCISKAWEFSHPAKVSNISLRRFSSQAHEHNRRFAHLNFQCRDRGVCHGLGGYFEAVLYDPENGEQPLAHSGTKTERLSPVTDQRTDKNRKIELSTNPLTADDKSKDMISWFPIFFPLQVPLYFPDNSLLSVSIWRQTNGRVVWYEWMVESFMLLDISADGSQKVERLGITDLHSSFATGCQL